MHEARRAADSAKAATPPLRMLLPLSVSLSQTFRFSFKWEFPKTGGYLIVGGPYNKDPTI